MKVKHLLPCPNSQESEILEVDYTKLMGKELTVELNNFLHTEYMAALMSFIKNLYKQKQLIYPRKIEDIFRVYRDYSEMMSSPATEPKVVIMTNEPLPYRESNGRAYGLYSCEEYQAKSSNLRPFIESIADHYAIDFNDYIRVLGVNHDISLDSYVEEGILMLPVIPVADGNDSLAYNSNFLPLTYNLIETITMNSCDTIFVFTNPFQEMFQPLLDRQGYTIIKTYELDNPLTFIDKIAEVHNSHTNEGKHSIVF